MARAVAVLATRKSELAIVLVGVLLRASMTLTFDVTDGYDWTAHYQYVQWIAAHGALPTIDLSAASYHPPLFYWLASKLVGAGVDKQALGRISIAAGCARIVVIWIGLELYLPRERLARIVALALLAGFPTDIHLDGMASNEALNTLFSATAMVLVPLVVGTDRPLRRRHLFGVALGMALGLALLSKVSAVMILLAVGVATGIGAAREAARGSWSMRPLLARLAPVATALVVTTAIAGWFYARNQRLYGKAFTTGYDGRNAVVVAAYMHTPFLDRRTIGYVVGFEDAIFDNPYYPVSSFPVARFSSALIASTFADSFNFGFGSPIVGEPAVTRNNRRIRESSVELSKWSVRAGFAIAVAVVVAWLVGVRQLWRQRDDARLALLLIPLFALLGQLAFAIRYPNDTFGPVKGLYMQFAAPPLYALFGTAVAWAWRRRYRRPLAIAGLCAEIVVATYSLQCRVPRIPGAIAARLSTPPAGRPSHR